MVVLKKLNREDLGRIDEVLQREIKPHFHLAGRKVTENIFETDKKKRHFVKSFLKQTCRQTISVTIYKM